MIACHYDLCVVPQFFKEMSHAAAVQAHIASKTVCVFTFSYCPYCVKAKDLLKKYTEDVALVEMDTMKDGDAFHGEVIKATGCGHDTAPATWIKGKFIGGFSELADLDGKGQLKAMLE